jgi:hypothetical protein
MSESWATIPSFPEYQINIEGEVRYTNSRDLLPMLKVYDVDCYVLVRDGKTWTKTQRGLIDETNPHILRRQEPVTESK